MKRYLGIILGFALVIILIGYGSKKYSAKALELDREADTARIKTEYLERVGWIRSNPDEKAYKEEVSTFFRWYFTQVNQHLNTFGGNRDFDGYLEELDKRGKGGKGGKEQQAADKRGYYDYTRKMFDQLKGSYAPTWSGTDKGMRLDVVQVSSVMNAGQPQVRFQLALWGAQRELREESKGTKKMVTSSSFNVTWKLYDEKVKLIGEMNAPGDPAMKVDFPERLIAEFPPQMVIGHYDIDLLPANAKTVDITFKVGSRSQSGGDISANYNWKLDVPAEWKLKTGEEWKGAQESVRPEEEINPAGAKKEAKK